MEETIKNITFYDFKGRKCSRKNAHMATISFGGLVQNTTNKAHFNLKKGDRVLWHCGKNRYPSQIVKL